MKIGIIGGSGIDDKLHMTDAQQLKVFTPYGAPSELPILGKINGIEAVVLARHGAHHAIMPSLVNYRANIWALKELGATHVVAFTACGSLREEIAPGHMVVLDQFIDRTTKRAQTFYEGQKVCHLPMAEPFCPKLRAILTTACKQLKVPHHAQGTMVTIEGPRFSTRAESKMFRMWGGDVINMTTVPEVVLAREAGLCYAAIAMATDYDCWHESHETVTLDMVMGTMKKNAENAHRILTQIIGAIRDEPCACRDAIQTSLI